MFSAAHALVVGGVREALHGHDWRVTVRLEGDRLDEDGLLCDFHMVERSLREITGAWSNRNLNECPPFSEGSKSVNPSAENVARVIAERLEAAIGSAIAGRARIESVRVTEAPGCAATFRRVKGRR